MLERRPRGAPKIRKVRSEGPPEFPTQLVATQGICEHQNGCQANKAPPGAPSLNWRVRPSQPTANRLVAAKQQQPTCRSLPSNAARSTAAKPSHQRQATSPTRPNHSTFFICFLVWHGICHCCGASHLLLAQSTKGKCSRPLVVLELAFAWAPRQQFGLEEQM